MWLALIAGVTGFNLGVFLMATMVAAKNADARSERFE